MSTLTEKYGKQALVTGASTGIGRAIAKQLAAAGMDVIVTARRMDLLESLAAEIRRDHGVVATPIHSDLSTVEGIERFIRDADAFEVDVLINNAGSAFPGAFLGASVAQQHASLILNVEAPIRLTHHFGRQMAIRGRGGVLFLGSTISYGTTPWMAHYAGTKNFVLAFAEGIREELAPLGVDVGVLAPGATRTPMTADFEGVEMEKLPIPWMDPDEVAPFGVRALLRRRSIVTGAANTALTSLAARLLPRKLGVKLIGAALGSVMTAASKDPKLDRPAAAA